MAEVANEIEFMSACAQRVITREREAGRTPEPVFTIAGEALRRYVAGVIGIEDFCTAALAADCATNDRARSDNKTGNEPTLAYVAGWAVSELARQAFRIACRNHNADEDLRGAQWIALQNATDMAGALYVARIYAEAVSTGDGDTAREAEMSWQLANWSGVREAVTGE
jgi:hypothetical protein